MIMNSKAVADVFQPQMPGLFFSVLSSGKVWILILLGPFVAVFPDFLANCLSKVFPDNPTVKILIKSKSRHHQLSQGNFDNQI